MLNELRAMVFNERSPLHLAEACMSAQFNCTYSRTYSTVVVIQPRVEFLRPPFRRACRRLRSITTMKQAGLGCIALLFAGLAQGLPYDFSCPTTNVNPAFALGYGYFDLDPTPAQAPYAPTAGISPSTFFISSATTAGFLQVWCANASTVVPPLGDGTDNFALPGQPEATVGCVKLYWFYVALICFGTLLMCHCLCTSTT